MYWNHRVIKKVCENGEIQLGIHEVFFNDDDTIHVYTTEPIEACILGEGENEDELLDNLREYVQWMVNALDKPILVDGEVEFVTDEIEDQIDEIMKLETIEEIDAALEELESELE